MAIDRIKYGKWARQAHMASAGFKAGINWAGNHLASYTLPQDKREAERERNMNTQAELWVQELGKLKGSIVKIGQILATYADYCLPPSIASALHQLEAETEPLRWEAISPYLLNSLQEKRQEIIVETTPIAAASLSQVHKARIKHSGKIICLKILYPEISKTLDSDLQIVEKSLALMLKSDEKKRLSSWISSIHQILLEEIDLQEESRKLLDWSARLSSDPRYVIPEAYQQYSGQGILAMSFESGVSQHDEAIANLPLNRRNILAESMLELFFKEIFIWGEMQTDPHPGNYRIKIDNKQDQLVLLDFGSVRKIDKKLLSGLQIMIISAYRNDKASLIESMFEMGLISPDATKDTQYAFADVLYGLVEPLNYKFKLANDPDSVPSYAYDENHDYCWRESNLPKRMAKQAVKSAISKDFSFPGADFLFISRKLAGVYAFIAALNARFDGGKVLKKVLKEKGVKID